MTNVTSSIVEQHNNLFDRITRARVAEDMSTLYPDIKQFVSNFQSVDKTSTDHIFKLYTDKLHDMLAENDLAYTRLVDQVDVLQNNEYDFAGEKDDTQAVQSRVLQLMAQLPKTKTAANAGIIANIIDQTIASGAISCKAVLELMKYPAYIDMISGRQRQNALDGSKSETQKAFERLTESGLKDLGTSLANVYFQGFHLRQLEKQIVQFQQSSVWGNEEVQTAKPFSYWSN